MNTLMRTILFLTMLLLVYGLLTFPVFHIHSTACICDQCLDEADADRIEQE